MFSHYSNTFSPSLKSVSSSNLALFLFSVQWPTAPNVLHHRNATVLMHISQAVTCSMSMLMTRWREGLGAGSAEQAALEQKQKKCWMKLVLEMQSELTVARVTLMLGCLNWSETQSFLLLYCRLQSRGKKSYCFSSYHIKCPYKNIPIST